MVAEPEVWTEGRREGERVVRKGRERDGGKLLLGIVVFRKIAFKSLSSRGHEKLQENTPHSLAQEKDGADRPHHPPHM